MSNEQVGQRRDSWDWATAAGFTGKGRGGGGCMVNVRAGAAGVDMVNHSRAGGREVGAIRLANVRGYVCGAGAAAGVSTGSIDVVP